MREHCIQLGLALLIGLGFHSCVVAQPSHLAGDAPLELLAASEEATLLANECWETYGFLAPHQQRFQQLLDSGSTSQIPVEQIGVGYSHSIRMLRSAKFLKMYGEPAGVDYEIRAGHCKKTFFDCYTATRNSAPGKAAADAARAQAEKMLPQVRKIVQQIQQHMGSGDWASAELLFYQLSDQLEVFLIWLSPKERAPIAAILNSVSNPIRKRMETSRKQRAQDDLMALIREVSPDVEAHKETISKCISQLGSAGFADVEGRLLQGPEFVQWLIESWKDHAASAIQCRAIEWAGESTGLKFSAGDKFQGGFGEKEDPGSVWYVEIDRLGQ